MDKALPFAKMMRLHTVFFPRSVFVHKVASTSAGYRAWGFRIIDQIYYLQLIAPV